jgi:hypothetical protein
MVNVQFDDQNSGVPAQTERGKVDEGLGGFLVDRKIAKNYGIKNIILLSIVSICLLITVIIIVKAVRGPSGLAPEEQLVHPQ